MRCSVMIAFGLALSMGCEKTAEDPSKYIGKAKCEADDGCGKGFICENKLCEKGERSAAHLAAVEKAEREAKAKAEAAKTAVQPGEGRLVVRICPGFKNTPEALGTVVATHQKTQKKHYIDLALRVSDGGWETEFTFYSLPLGKYDVTASYGIQVRGQPDGVHKLNCHEGVKKGCKDEVIREMEVVLPKDEPKPEVNKEGNPLKKPCDWLAE